MTKNEAIKQFGAVVVDKARDMYETDSGKVLFIEDCMYHDDCPLSAVDPGMVKNYLFRAEKFGDA